MEVVRTAIYNAASTGNLQSLRTYLEKKSEEEVKDSIHFKTNGATPLIMSCRNGHYTVVEYLVNTCGADIEQVGSVTFDGELIDGAPPLWCASAAGHLNIVRFLVKAGAQVNKTTFTNSTPLRAACFDGHFEIVQFLVEHEADVEIANRHGHTCLMISCYKGHLLIVRYLLGKGADVNRKSLKGNTALHDCAESGSLEIMKLLFNHSAKIEKDSYGMTPLLAAAVTGNTKIVEYLIERPECSKQDKVDSLELLGATFVDKKRDLLGAIKFWKAAMTERFSNKNGILRKPKSHPPVPAYNNAVEVQTIDELEELISDPDDMRMQALLIRERILGPAHPDTSYYIRYRGAVYADMGDFDWCVTLWMYALDMQQKHLEALSPLTQSSFLSFAELFSFMMSENHSRIKQIVSFKDMMIVFDKSVQELDKGMLQISKTPSSERDLTNFNRYLVIIVHLISLIGRMMSGLNDSSQFQFKKSVYRLVHMNPRGAQGLTPLHLACSKETTNVGRYPVCSFPDLTVIKILLEVGASVSAIDSDRNTALHVAARNQPCRPDVIQQLLNSGAHLDACNADKKTAVDLLQGVAIHDVVPPARFITLQCWAAKTVIKFGIPYRGQIPSKLEAFIRMH